MPRRIAISFHYPRRHSGHAVLDAASHSRRGPKQRFIHWVLAGCGLVVFSGILLVGAAIGMAVAALLTALVGLAFAVILVRGMLSRAQRTDPDKPVPRL